MAAGARDGAAPPAARAGAAAGGWPVAAGLLLGWAADRALGDPRRWHPVAGYGRSAAVLERALHPQDRRAAGSPGGTAAGERAAGAAFALVAVGVPTALALQAQRRLARRPAALAAATAVTAWAAIGGRQLGEVAGRIDACLAAEDLAAARRWLPWLVGRDPAGLDAGGIARAVVESVAENTADAVTGPLVWGALAGPAGIVAHRCANTLDAVVGHRSPRYARFGTAAARLDDVLGWLPARAAAAATVLVAPAVGGSPAAAWAAWRADGRRHPSPNAGPVEAAAAGALGRTLGGPVRYGDRVEVRGPLGEGPPPGPQDIRRAVRLSQLVGGLVAVAAAGLAVACAPRS